MKRAFTLIEFMTVAVVVGLIACLGWFLIDLCMGSVGSAPGKILAKDFSPAHTSYTTNTIHTGKSTSFVTTPVSHPEEWRMTIHTDIGDFTAPCSSRAWDAAKVGAPAVMYYRKGYISKGIYPTVISLDSLEDGGAR